LGTADRKALHWLEKKALSYLVVKKKSSLEDLARESGASLDQIRRTVGWLKEKGYIEVKTDVKKFIELGPSGRAVARDGLPERRLFNLVVSKGAVDLAGLKAESGMQSLEFDAALGRARRLGWVTISADGKVSVSNRSVPETHLEKLIRALEAGALDEDSLGPDARAALMEASRRPGLVAKKEVKSVTVSLIRAPRNEDLAEEGHVLLTPSLLRESHGKAVLLARLDVTSPVPILNPGRIHPISRLEAEVREALVSMGFEEIGGALVQPSFWNFDVLFTPQDHPARDMQDSLYLQGVSSKVRDRTLVRKVKGVHENGASTGSRGWGYRWSLAEAQRSVLRTHTTALSCRYLSANPRKESRVFSIGRVFRNESPDATHLFEFTQIEGVVSEKDANARKLLGYMTQFYRSLGFSDVKFNPSYFPYTEPSFEPLVYSKEMKQWVELGGSGVFRPEVVLPLGVKNNVLAWGFGLERIALLRYGLKDVRSIYSNDLRWLRGVSEYQ
jgi:phenylalanyl-tRNA synthetase alpha chain